MSVALKYVIVYEKIGFKLCLWEGIDSRNREDSIKALGLA